MNKDTMLLNTSDYFTVLADIKTRISTARIRAVLSVNTELVNLYWQIGTILNRHKTWGNKFIENLARDIKLEFPEATGYSFRNLRYMAQFADTHPDGIWQQPVAKLPWGHNIALMTRVFDQNERVWYAQQALEHGWSRNTLEIQIDTKLYRRQVTTHKATNFTERLPPLQSDLVGQAIKDTYIFDFLGHQNDLHERKLEEGLVNNVTKLLMELGSGFAFVGQQYGIEVEGRDFYIDLLFYHLKLPRIHRSMPTPRPLMGVLAALATLRRRPAFHRVTALPAHPSGAARYGSDRWIRGYVATSLLNSKRESSNRSLPENSTSMYLLSMSFSAIRPMLLRSVYCFAGTRQV